MSTYAAARAVLSIVFASAQKARADGTVRIFPFAAHASAAVRAREILMRVRMRSKMPRMGVLRCGNRNCVVLPQHCAVALLRLTVRLSALAPVALRIEQRARKSKSWTTFQLRTISLLFAPGHFGGKSTMLTAVFQQFRQRPHLFFLGPSTLPLGF
jgi:hypothetical protein